MSAPDRTEADEAALCDLVENPEAWEFFAAVLQAQGVRRGAAGAGRAARIEEDVLRFSQRASLRFEAAPVVRAGWAQRGEARVFEIEQTAFGPLGPLGGLPLHVTDDAIREERSGRPWLRGFLDLFTHRLVGFLYRTWEAASPAASRALGPRDDPWPAWVGAFAGIGPAALRDRDALPDDLRRFAAGWLGAGRRSAAAAAGIAEIVTGAPATVEPFAPEWLPMPEADQCRPGLGAAGLGVDAALGPRFYSVATRFRLRTAPLDRARFEALLPGGALHAPLRDAMRSLMGLGWAWDLTPVLRAEAARPVALDGGGRLGLDSWLGGARGRNALDDVTLAMER